MSMKNPMIPSGIEPVCPRSACVFINSPNIYCEEYQELHVSAILVAITGLYRRTWRVLAHSCRMSLDYFTWYTLQCFLCYRIVGWLHLEIVPTPRPPLWNPKFHYPLLTFYSLLVTWCTNSLTFNNCTLCPQCIYVFCVYLRTNSDLCHLQHKLIGFYNRDEKCLQRGTN